MIIAMTADVMENSRQICFDAGMKDYISKPVQPAHLEETLIKWVEQSLVVI